MTAVVCSILDCIFWFRNLKSPSTARFCFIKIHFQLFLTNLTTRKSERDFCETKWQKYCNKIEKFNFKSETLQVL